MRMRRVKGKLKKNNVMRKHPVLRRHLPETHRLRKGVLARMIKRYGTLFIKPDKGSQGVGIVRLRRRGRRKILISWGLRHRQVKRRLVGQTVRQILHAKKTYLVQQGIRLAKYRNRLVDIRVLMQKPNSNWRISGQVVRVAARGRFVTNYHQGARPKPLQKVLATIYKGKPGKIQSTIRNIKNISVTTAKVLYRKFPGIRQLGIDLALDRGGRIWIIEANTNPGTMLFKSLKNKRMYRVIAARRRYLRAKYR